VMAESTAKKDENDFQDKLDSARDMEASDRMIDNEKANEEELNQMMQHDDSSGGSVDHNDIKGDVDEYDIAVPKDRKSSVHVDD
jgi:hypothetical protein